MDLFVGLNSISTIILHGGGDEFAIFTLILAFDM